MTPHRLLGSVQMLDRTGVTPVLLKIIQLWWTLPWLYLKHIISIEAFFMAVLVWYMRNSIAIDSCACTMCTWLVSLYGAPSCIALHQKYKYFSFYGIHLPHWCRVTQIYGSKLTIIISDNGVLPRSAPSLYLNQCRNIVYWIPENKLQ